MYLVQIGAPVTHNIIASNQFTGCVFFLGIGWTSSGWKKNDGAGIWGSMCMPNGCLLWKITSG